LKPQALVEQELLPADQAQVLQEVGSLFWLSRKEVWVRGLSGRGSSALSSVPGTAKKWMKEPRSSWHQNLDIKWMVWN
jgi:uncharacterized membrane protein